MLYDGNNTLTFDNENRLVSNYSQSSGTSTYDDNDIRVKKVSGGTTTVYVFSGSKDIAEYSVTQSPPTNTLQREYIYSGGKLVATLTPAQGGGTTTVYHHADHLSVRVTTDASGNKIGEQGHYPYGEQCYVSGTTTKFFFTTYERDGESGNDYAMARFYINRFGRFCSMDPVDGNPADPQSWNHYVYARDNPVNLTDPSGKFWGWLFALFAHFFQHIWQGMHFAFHFDFAHAFTVLGGHASAGTWTLYWNGMPITESFSLSTTISSAAVIGGPVALGSAVPGSPSAPQQQPLKQRLASDLKNPDCAALLGGTQKAAEALKHFSGTSPTNAIEGARTQVPLGGNFAGAKWTGQNFTTQVGSFFRGSAPSVQETMMIHEFIHVAKGATPISNAAIDMMRPNVPGLAGRRIDNIYDIYKNCGTALKLSRL